MASVFENETGAYSQTVTIQRPLRLRQGPLEYLHRGLWLIQGDTVLKTGDWLYTALDEITLKTEAPAWSWEGWSFLPIGLQALPNMTLNQHMGRKQPENDENTSPVANVSFITTALKARLDCTSVPVLNDFWLDDINVKYSGQLYETRKGYAVPSILFDNTPYNTSTRSSPSRLRCCTNQTAPESLSAIGYWSFNNPNRWNWTVPRLDRSEWPGNFLVKWILGIANTITVGETQANTGNIVRNMSLLYFPKAPKLQALECSPVIEYADAKVTVARASGQVLEYEILESPRPAVEAWSAAFEPSGPIDVPISNQSNTSDVLVRTRFVALNDDHCRAVY